jgi:hypothetical protein
VLAGVPTLYPLPNPGCRSAWQRVRRIGTGSATDADPTGTLRSDVALFGSESREENFGFTARVDDALLGWVALVAVG